MNSTANDWYGLPLKKGDFVVPMSSDMLSNEISGTITKLYKHRGLWYINIRTSRTNKLIGLHPNNFTLESRLSHH